MNNSSPFSPPYQLVSYLAPSAPATRRPAEGDEPFLRPEVGFTPKWYHEALGIDFGERWHTNWLYRRQTVLAMRAELRERFPDTRIGRIDRMDWPPDSLTGVFGATTIAGIYGIPIVYAADRWPDTEHRYLNGDEVDALVPPNLESNPHFRQLRDQVDAIAQNEGRTEGFINWQGVLNNAHRIRGEQVFSDMLAAPDRCRRLFDCVCTTMIDAALWLHQRQRAGGVHHTFFTISNCLVNMVSPEQYRDLLLPFDLRIAEAFECIGIHNCAWNATPYLDAYATIPRVGYIDMGLESDLENARRLFPGARRALMYTPMDLANKPLGEIERDLLRIAGEYGPCDLVCADVEAGTPGDRVLAVIEICDRISRDKSGV